MAETVKCPDQFVFGLDIGTRSLVGTIGYGDSKGFHVVAMDVMEHSTRAMLDGQVHDINVVGTEIKELKSKLEDKIGRKLTNVCIAAAGRVLRTINITTEISVDPEVKITSEDIFSLDSKGIELAHRQINEDSDGVNYYCVGYTPVKYFLNGYEISNLEGHKGSEIKVILIATFLPEEVVDGLYSAVELAGLEVANLTLEPIAAMNVAIPEQYRLLNIALVDVGAGTSDICITKDGSIIAYGMIPCAGDEITEIIAKHYLVDFDTAEKIKIGAGKKAKIIFKDIMGTKTTVDPKEVNALISDVVKQITKDVADKIKELNGDKSVNAVFIVGGGGKIPAFAKELAKELDIPEARVALRGKEVLEDVEFAIDNIKKDSLYVTPVGICINYYNQRNNFISVTVNGNKIKLYDNSNLTVIDALMQSGYPNEQLFPRRGPSINYTLNNEARMIRGTSGEPAKILKNGKECTLTSKINKNDYIDVEESTFGKTVDTRLDEIREFNMAVSFNVNSNKITCPRFAYVNGKIESGSYIIKDGDAIVMEEFYTVEQLFSFMDISIEDKEIIVNNEIADKNTAVYPNFKVTYKTIETEDSFAPDTQSTKTSDETKAAITVNVNNTPVMLSGKKEYTFVDILDFYPFDTKTIGGDALVTTVNGENVDFSAPVKNGDDIMLYWK